MNRREFLGIGLGVGLGLMIKTPSRAPKRLVPERVRVIDLSHEMVIVWESDAQVMGASIGAGLGFALDKILAQILFPDRVIAGRQTIKVRRPDPREGVLCLRGSETPLQVAERWPEEVADKSSPREDGAEFLGAGAAGRQPEPVPSLLFQKM